MQTSTPAKFVMKRTNEIVGLKYEECNTAITIAVITCFCHILRILLECKENLMFSLEQNGENLMIRSEEKKSAHLKLFYN